MDSYYYDGYAGEHTLIYRDLSGKPVKKTPRSHPYSYDDFVLYKSDDFDQMDCMVYHDRMLSWDREAFSRAVREVWPDMPQSHIFSGKQPEEINRFLDLYFGRKTKLTAVLQGCNQSSGYPHWIFAYKEVEQGEK